jgi:hypothetical protein
MKDALATVGFVLILTALFTRGNDWCPRRILILLVVACIIGDGLFTLNPTWHFTILGENIPTTFIIIQTILLIGCGVSLITRII